MVILTPGIARGMILTGRLTTACRRTAIIPAITPAMAWGCMGWVEIIVRCVATTQASVPPLLWVRAGTRTVIIDPLLPA
jgi:hypothetical protein